MTDLHIVYTRAGDMILSKRRYSRWQEIQEEYDDYMTSLGPWNSEEVIDFLQFEYPDLSPSASEQVGQLLSGDAETLKATFES